MVIEALRYSMISSAPSLLLPSSHIHVHPPPPPPPKQQLTIFSLQIHHPLYHHHHHHHRLIIRTTATTTSSPTTNPLNFPSRKTSSIKCTENPNPQTLMTCKNCKTQFDPSLNHPRACRFHTSHFGGETKRKFESVHSGGTMNTPDAGRVLQYWHCCGSEDPFDGGCTAAPHSSYDD